MSDCSTKRATGFKAVAVIDGQMVSAMARQSGGAGNLRFAYDSWWREGAANVPPRPQVASYTVGHTTHFDEDAPGTIFDSLQAAKSFGGMYAGTGFRVLEVEAVVLTGEALSRLNRRIAWSQGPNTLYATQVTPKRIAF